MLLDVIKVEVMDDYKLFANSTVILVPLITGLPGITSGEMHIFSL